MASAAALLTSGALGAPRPGDLEADAAEVEAETDAERAQALLDRGIRASAAGRGDEAAELLERAVALEPSAAGYFHLARARESSSRFAAALEAYRALLARTWDPNLATYAVAARAAVLELEGRVAHLELDVVMVAGLRLTLDDAPVPLSRIADIELDPGPHVVRARAPGKDTREARIDAAEGGRYVVSVALAPEVVSSPPERPAPPPIAPLPRPFGEWMAIGAVGAGAASIGVACTVGAIALGQAAGAAGPDSAEADAARDKALVADFFGAVGIVALGVGLVVLSNASPSIARRDPTAIRF